MVLSEKVKSVLSCGLALHKIGICNWALTHEQALLAFDTLRNGNAAVLGGDVYEAIDGEAEPNYDNWFCDRKDDEKLNDYVERSIKHAHSFVTKYSNPNGRDPLFVLIVEE